MTRLPGVTGPGPAPPDDVRHVVGVCDGQRCRAVRRLAPHDPLLQLRDVVSGTPGAVLLRLDCPGLCAYGVIGLMATGRPTERVGTWLACVDRQERGEALLEWARHPATADDGALLLPSALADAVVPGP
ncbi:hypothetical protein [Motilibacter deserti]|uniref:Metal-binding protein n=1 Tax=Motilibacter deserti TaxID=2714956 RepID=A0ABX0GYK6_9ACTN|nr:hypothetical protein [Motilibacter deserti]NHC14790.1 hypothetical protein [Motilibacter deserti]